MSLIGFVFIFGGAIVGMILRRVLPDHHLRDDSRDVIKLATGLVGTISALVLGLLIASAKGSYDAQTTETEKILDQSWSKNGTRAYRLDTASIGGGVLYDKIQALNPSDELQRSIKSQALSLTVNIGQLCMLMYEQATLVVSKPLLVIMVFWLTVTFVIWGLLAPPNGTVIAVMLASALSASGAILLILEMYSPYEGFIRVADAPLRAALAHLGH
ncbi:hypothetical protein [Edaphobacter aggregans]|uniref:bestrophin-like domain n=1 Tax=Edaphobacter aggregans TaxID=570835 RepID=UPI000691293E|nr:hypothetical protein [Edaphobacter aggregans]